MEHISKHLVQVKTGLTNLNDGSLEDIKKSLRYAMLKVGLRAANLPTDEEKQILLDHIMRYYGNHTADEIKLAFDLAITDKLDIDTKDVVCYENFSCLYFSTIMNAYRKWVSDQYRNGKLEAVKQKLVEYKPDMDLIEKEYNDFLQTDLGKRLKNGIQDK